MLDMPVDNNSGGMYIDLATELKLLGHEVTIMAPDNSFKKSYIAYERDMEVLRVKCKKTLGESNLIKKGIGLALMPYYYKIAYKKYLGNRSFDWIIMSTPPITLIDFVEYVQKKTTAKLYLILRDIHPQSSKSIGLIKYKFMYDYLEKRALKGYQVADVIGCMSQGNIDFIANNYPMINPNKLVLLYNWLKKEVIPNLDFEHIRCKYGLSNKLIVIFGGTIGLGQRIENILMLAREYKDNEGIRFLIIGKGVEKDRLMKLSKDEGLTNMIFIDFMPQAEYLTFMSKADIGLISLNENYKVPTCPSKAVAYMSLGIPIFAIINPDNDYKSFIEDSGAGLVVIGGNKIDTIRKFNKLITDGELRNAMSKNGREFYEKYLTVEIAANEIIKQMEQTNERG